MGKNKKFGSNAVIIILVIVIVAMFFLAVLPKFGVHIPFATTTTTNETDNSVNASIMGKVQDYFSSSPLQAANVYILTESGARISAVTDSDGVFKTTDTVPSGTTISIEVVKSGYLIAYVENIVLTADNITTKDNTDYFYIQNAFALIPQSAISVSLYDGSDNAISGSYNMTQYGADLLMDIRVTVTTDEAGWGQSYHDLSSPIPNDAKNIYVGGILVVALDTNYVRIDNGYSFQRAPGMGNIAYYYVNMGQILHFEDAGQDGKVSYKIGLTCLAAGSNAIQISLYNSISQYNLENGYFSGVTPDTSVAISIVS